MNSEIRKILFRIIFVSSRVDNSIYDMVYIRFDIESRSHGWEVRIESYVIECGAERRKMLKYWKINGKDWILKYGWKILFRISTHRKDWSGYRENDDNILEKDFRDISTLIITSLPSNLLICIHHFFSSLYYDRLPSNSIQFRRSSGGTALKQSEGPLPIAKSRAARSTRLFEETSSLHVSHFSLSVYTYMYMYTSYTLHKVDQDKA